MKSKNKSTGAKHGYEDRIENWEFSFEGSKELFEAKFESVFKEIVGTGKEKISANPSAAYAAAPAKLAPVIPTMTVKSVAAKLGVDSGSELVYAAIASLTIIKNKEVVTRHEINDEMKLAIGYYKPNYSSGNLTGYLDALCKKGTIIETAKDTYAVKEAAKAEMEQKLA